MRYREGQAVLVKFYPDQPARRTTVDVSPLQGETESANHVFTKAWGWVKKDQIRQA